MIKVNYEHTDTFGGESNYSWVNRGTIELPEGTSDRSIVRAVKAALGMTGARCTKSSYGDLIELRPRGVCHVIFITFGE